MEATRKNGIVGITREVKKALIAAMLIAINNKDVLVFNSIGEGLNISGQIGTANISGQIGVDNKYFILTHTLDPKSKLINLSSNLENLSNFSIGTTNFNEISITIAGQTFYLTKDGDGFAVKDDKSNIVLHIKENHIYDAANTPLIMLNTSINPSCIDFAQLWNRLAA